MDTVSTCFLSLVVPCLPEVPSRSCRWDEPCEDCACTKCVHTSLPAQWRMCAGACTHLALASAFTLTAYTRHALVVIVCGVQYVGKKLLLTLAMSFYVLNLLKWTHDTFGRTYAFCKAILSRAIASPLSPTSDGLVVGRPRLRRCCTVSPRHLPGSRIRSSPAIPARRQWWHEARLKKSGQLHLNRWSLLHRWS